MTHRNTSICFAAALTALALAALPAAATVVKSLSVEDLTREADLVVEATVERQTVTWDEQRKLIYTFTEVRVSEAIKGPAKAGQQIVIRQIGGEIGDEALLVSGNASMQPGEEVILFLDSDEALPLHYVVAMAQGKYSIARDGAKAHVARNTHGLTYLDKDAAEGLPRLARPAAKTHQRVDLETFKAQLRRFVETERDSD